MTTGHTKMMKLCNGGAVLQIVLLGICVNVRSEEAFKKWAERDREELRGFDRSTDTRSAVKLVGVYAVEGQDEIWGAYTGESEVRPLTGKGGLKLISTRLYTDARFEGDRIALAWEGIVLSPTEPYQFEVRLEQSGFIIEYKQWKRTPKPVPPLLLKGAFMRDAKGLLRGVFKAANQTKPMFSETWTRSAESGARPIWQNMRRVIAAHREPTKEERMALFASFATYHAQPAVLPYKSRPEFKRAVHGFVFDPTDYEFYRRNPDVLRVIQKVPDAICLVETRIRNRAYRQTLAQKAARFDEDMPVHFLNSVGMIEYVDESAEVGKQSYADVDGMAWTGDYVAAQAMRYLVTGEPVAFDNMLRSLRGLILCYDMVPEKGAFARTVRKHTAGATMTQGGWKWIRGTGEHAQYDWLAGCNNDMLKGYWNGFLWAHIALLQKGGYADLEQSMARIVGELIADNADVGDSSPDEAYAHLLRYALSDDLLAYGKYLAMFVYLKPWLVDFGDGSTYELGVSDWSGCYMHIKTLVNFYILEAHLAKRGKKVSHVDDYKRALAKGLKRMQHTRLGFFQLASASLGDFVEPPPELEDALWVLREFPAPKVAHDYDWRINRGFCLSPIPNLPWKMDWTTSDRTLSLNTYPLIERNASSVQWKEIPATYHGTASSVTQSGVDFLSAYWLGRHSGTIDDEM